MVRETILTFEAIVATRNDQGQLASMQNKFVRIALERLRLSIKEFLGELPASMDAAYNAAISPDRANELRLFVPTTLGQSLDAWRYYRKLIASVAHRGSHAAP